MILFNCGFEIELSLMFGGHKAAICTVFWLTKNFTGALLVVDTGWAEIKNFQFYAYEL